MTENVCCTAVFVCEDGLCPSLAARYGLAILSNPGHHDCLLWHDIYVTVKSLSRSHTYTLVAPSLTDGITFLKFLQLPSVGDCFFPPI